MHEPAKSDAGEAVLQDRMRGADVPSWENCAIAPLAGDVLKVAAGHARLHAPSCSTCTFSGAARRRRAAEQRHGAANPDSIATNLSVSASRVPTSATTGAPRPHVSACVQVCDPNGKKCIAWNATKTVLSFI